MSDDVGERFEQRDGQGVTSGQATSEGNRRRIRGDLGAAGGEEDQDEEC